MTTVQYTIAKTVKGEFTNVYKNREFKTATAAKKFAESLKAKSNVTDIRILN